MKKLNCSTKLPLFVFLRFGTQREIANIVINPKLAIIPNVNRHEKTCPNFVPNGTPTKFANVNPANIIEIACASFPFVANCAATTDPTPKNAP